MRGKLDAREIGDVGDTALSFSEVKALATGNPLLMDKAEADVALARLQRAERAHHRNQDALRHAVAAHEHDIEVLTRQAAEVDAAVARRQDTRGDRFAMTVGEREHRKRAEAGQHLKEVLQEEVTALSGPRERRSRAGQLGGFPLVTEVSSALGKTSVSITLDGAPGVSISMPARELGKADPGTLVTRLEHRLHHLEDRKASILADAAGARREIDHARESIGEAFPRAAELAQARERAREIDGQLAKMAAPPQADAQPGAKPAPPQPGAQPAPASPQASRGSSGPAALTPGRRCSPVRRRRRNPRTPCRRRNPGRPPGQAEPRKPATTAWDGNRGTWKRRGPGTYRRAPGQPRRNLRVRLRGRGSSGPRALNPPARELSRAGTPHHPPRLRLTAAGTRAKCPRRGRPRRHRRACRPRPRQQDPKAGSGSSGPKALSPGMRTPSRSGTPARRPATEAATSGIPNRALR